ncbi:unnamed protein product [Blepharisma stoltei]|uniref:EF-hand domain-containing protein n=1 Tax=Blepharisma stoltei TaxID=1481888 RepID=A0AAU9IY08_9CILI|nr:unnamed protein product [Blepharisma stoltei]
MSHKEASKPNPQFTRRGSKSKTLALLFSQSQMFNDIQPSLPRPLVYRGLNLRRLSFRDLSEEIERMEYHPSHRFDRQDFTSDEIRAIFRMFCKQKTMISEEDLYEMMKSVGENVSLEEVKEVFKAVDEDGDGMINFHDFYHLMNS